MAKEIRLPKLTGYQQAVMDWMGDFTGGKVAVIKSVRQSGKSFFAMMALTKVALERKTISVMFSPTMDQARVFFKSISDALSAVNLVETANSQTNIIQLKNGSQIIFRSTTLENSNRGYTVTGLLVFDECAFLPDDAIYTALPLVNAHNAPILICSTPFIRQGYYYEMYKLGMTGENPNVKTFDWANDAEVSRFLTDERKAFYKKTMSRSKYTTEVLGEFLSDDGALFCNIQNCIGKPQEPHLFYIGIDFANGGENDYTVLCAFNEYGQMYRIAARNNLSPTQQIDWLTGEIHDLNSIATVVKIYAEINSIGQVYVDLMDARLPKDVKITDWVTSNKSKQELVTSFQLALENNYVTILRDEELITELQGYTQEISPKTKTITYNGKNCHDDYVMASMLGYMAYKNPTAQGQYVLSKGTHNTKPQRLREKYG